MSILVLGSVGRDFKKLKIRSLTTDIEKRRKTERRRRKGDEGL